MRASLLRAACAAAVVGVLATACTSSSTPDDDDATASPSAIDSSPGATPGADQPTTLRWALSANPSSIDPRFAVDDDGLLVADALFDSLVALDDDLTTVVPAAAASWTTSDDGLVFTFTLRPGAAYSDGTPVEAGDFVRSFQRIVARDVEPASFQYRLLEPVVGFEEAVANGVPLSGVTAVDPSTLQIDLQYPVAEFLEVLAHPALAPVPAAADDVAAFANQPIGNGPFAMVQEWQQNQFIRVARVDGHPTEADVDEVVFQIYAGDATREQQFADFERGQLDVAEVPPAQLGSAAEAHGSSSDGFTGPGVLSGTTSTLYYFGFNTDRAPFDDPDVRRAISMVIDRGAIVDDLTFGARVAADTLVPPSLPGGGQGRCGYCVHDVAAARALLGGDEGGSETPSPGDTTSPSDSETPEDAGLLPMEEPLRLVHNTGETNARIAQAVAGAIESALEVDVEVEAADLDDYLEVLRTGDMHLFRLGYQAEYPSPGALLQPLFRTANVGSDNLSRFSDSEVDRLLGLARETSDPGARQDLYTETETLVLDAMPIAPIFFYRHTKVVADGVDGLTLDALGRVRLHEVTKAAAG